MAQLTEHFITVTDIRRNFKTIVRRLQRLGDHAVIKSGGSPVAVLLSMNEYEELLRYKKILAFEKFTRDFGRAVAKRGLSEDALMTELEESKREVFRGQYGKPN
jgi:prevent-host-death family protein